MGTSQIPQHGQNDLSRIVSRQLLKNVVGHLRLIIGIVRDAADDDKGDPVVAQAWATAPPSISTQPGSSRETMSAFTLLSEMN